MQKMAKNPIKIKEIPPLVMVSIDKKNKNIFSGEQGILSTCFRIFEPKDFGDKTKNSILYECGKIVNKENKKALAVFVAASFFCKEIEDDEEIKSEFFVISCLTKTGATLARIIPVDRDPEGNVLLLNTKNQFSTNNFDFDFIKEFYKGYNSSNWSFSKMFGDN